MSDPSPVDRYSPELLEAARSGDEGAWRLLLESAQPDVRRYAGFTCRGADDINDAVQETLWLLYRKLGTVRTFAALSGWLFTVVRRECLRLAHRAMGTSTAKLGIEVVEDNLRFSHRPEEELRIDLARAIGSLPDHYREIVILRDIHELAIGEISDSLGLSRESVKARLHRARLLIREYLLKE